MAVGPSVEKLVEDLGDWLGSHAGQPDLGVQLGEWLVNNRVVEDVFADDETLEATVLDEAAKAKEKVGAPLPDEPEDDDDLAGDADDEL